MKNDISVIDFINSFRGDKNTEKAIVNHFTDGYCYYFAEILKKAFNRGEVYWAGLTSHIVWIDEDGTVYDIEGVYDNEDVSLYIPIERLGDTINFFKGTSSRDVTLFESELYMIYEDYRLEKELDEELEEVEIINEQFN